MKVIYSLVAVKCGQGVFLCVAILHDCVLRFQNFQFFLLKYQVFRVIIGNRKLTRNRELGVICLEETEVVRVSIGTKSKANNQSSNLMLAIGLGFILISMGFLSFLLLRRHEYDMQKSQVDDVRDKVVAIATIPAVVDEKDDTQEQLKINDANLFRTVDFQALQEINEDATRWLYIPDTPIDSYVMQEPEVAIYKYLWRDIYGKKSRGGSLLTPRVPLDKDDAHLIIFGHRINSYEDLAFSSLRRLFADAESAADFPYVYLYYEDRAERWAVWSVSDVYGSDDIYKYPYILGTDEYETVLGLIRDKSRFENFEMPDKNTRVLILSTCNGSQGGSNVRLIVTCVPDVTYYYKTGSVDIFRDVSVETTDGIHKTISGHISATESEADASEGA